MDQIPGRDQSPVSPIGRHHELLVLGAALERTRSGSSGLLLIGGEAGIGKTTLVEEFLPEARRSGASILTGACFDVTSPSPYAAWEDIFQSLAKIDAPSMESADWLSEDHLDSLPDQSALFNQVLQRLSDLAANNALVLVLEDIHWADRGSLELLRYLGRSLRNIPVLIISTYRSDEIINGHPLYDTILHLVREARAERIDLRRFSRMAIEELIESWYSLAQTDRDRLVEELERRTDGNPFFLVELLRSMEMNDLLYQEGNQWQLASMIDVEIPILVRQVIDRRFSELDERARSALQAAAVLGYDIQPNLWASVTELDEADLSEVVRQALDAFILEQSPRSTRLQFRHALVQEALYSGLPLPVRQSMHRRAARTLSQLPGADATMIAEHFTRAEDPEAATWSLEAARRARRLFAPHSVIQCLALSSDESTSLSQRELIEAHQLRGWAHEISGEFEAAYQDYLSELRVARETADQYAEWDALIRLAELWAGRDYERAGEYVARALELAENVGDQSLLAHSLNRMGNWHLNRENPDRARKFHEQALSIFEHIEHREGLAATFDLLGITCYMGGDVVEGTQHYKRAIELFESLDNRQGLVSSLANYSMRGITYHTDMMTALRTTLDDCIADAERALDVATGIDFRAGEVYALIRLGSCCGSRGQYQRSLDLLNQGIAGAQEIGHLQWMTAAHCVISATYLDILDAKSARWHLEQVASLAEETGSRHWVRFNSGISAMASLALGRTSEAREHLKQTWMDNVPAQTMAQRNVWHGRIEYELALGNPETAIQLVDWILDSTAYAGRERPSVQLSLLRARALSELEQFEEAESWLGPALEIAQYQGARPMVWRILCQQGRIRAAQGARACATEKFRSARGIIEELSETLDDPEERFRFVSTACQQMPEALSRTDLQIAKQRFGGLTRRQREVAVLIVEGSSNREIADRLSISERTVESHITAMLSTLSLASRAQIAAWCVTNGLAANVAPPSR